MSRAWGGWSNVGTWDLVVWGLGALLCLSGGAAKVWKEAGDTESARFPSTRVCHPS